jgi:hypothetical protein
MNESSKSYFLAISLLALVGIVFAFENYPALIGISSFLVGLGYKQYSSPDKESSDELIDQD